jgi:hypothetical protein
MDSAVRSIAVLAVVVACQASRNSVAWDTKRDNLIYCVKTFHGGALHAFDKG